MKLFYSLLLFALAGSAAAQQRWYQKPFYHASALDAGNTGIFLNNSGTADYSILGGNSQGAWWNGKYNTIVYNQGLCILGKIDTARKAILSLWSPGFSPGPIVNGKAALDFLSAAPSRYRTYKITRGDTWSSSKDLREWPADLGAPVAIYLQR